MSTFELRNNKIFLNGVEDSLVSTEITRIDFLGASVSSITASAGWDGSRSQCSISLAEDWADNQEFVTPIVGSPQFFEIRDTSDRLLWSFNGIVKSINREVSPAGGRTFSVNLESPETILEAAAVILDNYPGKGNSLDTDNALLTQFGEQDYNWGSIYNVINVFGFWENDQYGIESAAFGLADNNSSGMPWQNALIALNEIINRRRIGSNILPFSANELGGSLAFSSTSYNQGEPYFYAVDFDKMAEALTASGLPNEFRVSANSVLGIIQELCEGGNCQWHITLDRNEIGLKSPYTNQDVDGIITIRAFSLNELPTIGTITNFSLAKEATGKRLTTDLPENQLVFPDALEAYVASENSMLNMSSSSLGIELADVTTGKVVIGGFRTQMVEQLPSKTYMYWGNLAAKNPYFGDIPIMTPLLSPVSSSDVIPVDVRGIVGDNSIGEEEFGREYYLSNSSLLPPTIINGIYYASILELRCAANDQESWENYLTFFKRKKSEDLEIQGDLREPTKAGELSLFGELKATDLDTIFDNYNTSKAAIDKTQGGHVGDRENNKNHLIWKKLQGLYNDYYGKEFLVPIPVSAYKWEPESKNFVTEWDITDSAFTDENSGPNAPDFDVKFADTSGRTVPYAGFPLGVTINDTTGLTITDNLDFSEIEGDQSTVIGNRVYIKTSVDQETKYTTFPLPITFGAGAYGHKPSNTGFQYPQMLTTLDPALLSLKTSKLTKNLFGFYTDNRGAVPFARITLPGKVKYMKHAIGFSHDFDGLGLISEILQKGQDNRDGRNKSEILVGGDRIQTPIGDGYYLPELMSVPLRSNRYTYGPWLPTFDEYIAGKVELVVESDLVPENFVIPGFGLGHTGMDYFGFSQALPDRIGYFATESGSFTLAGVPKTNIGEKLIEGGPYVTDVNISIDPDSGLTTTFTMKTWDLDFGRIKKHYLDRFKRLADSSLRLAKNLTDREVQKIQLRNFLRNPKFSPPERFRSHSSSTVIAGYVNKTVRKKDNLITPLKAATVAVMPVHNLLGNISADYENVGACSLDAILSPFTCDYAYSGNLPKLDENPTEPHGTQTQLNPIFPHGVTDANSFRVYGNNFHLTVRGSSIPDDLNSKFALENDDFNLNDPYGKDQLDVRSMALRTPNIRAGYGYDTNGHFLPSGEDGEPTDDFHLDISSHKVGPELQVFDQYKKIWVGDFPIMKGLLLSDLSAGTITGFASAEVVRYVSNPDDNTYTLVTREDIYCEDATFPTAVKGSMVYYVNIDGKNMPIYSSCSASAANLQIVTDYLNE